MVRLATVAARALVSSSGPWWRLCLCIVFVGGWEGWAEQRQMHEQEGIRLCVCGGGGVSYVAGLYHNVQRPAHATQPTSCVGAVESMREERKPGLIQSGFQLFSISRKLPPSQ